MAHVHHETLRPGGSDGWDDSDSSTALLTSRMSSLSSPSYKPPHPLILKAPIVGQYNFSGTFIGAVSLKGSGFYACRHLLNEPLGGHGVHVKRGNLHV